ncbi:hypothetical protein GCM10025868_22100 [Angustibacter aerolatus]|uniref:Peptidoglycan binding-like domain-containing protein n=1 Tax=Angustibacter aerolatus TaxID=1162965 RepID=A0ABQ6JI97_9ACTN|nr:peptidoglycan-binding protein [Angustibacter aerolatus]GMA86960.1 hypothetical protein GCM10025868_22100 [Angustibacter aerolatus]
MQDVGAFRVVGENVGVGGSEAGLHSAFMHSPGHRANILSKDYTQVGIGVAFGGGRTWVAEVFRKPAPAAKKPSTSTKTLHLGSRGASVKRLQRILHVHPTGYFGPVTRSRLKEWQHAHHLKATGNLNRITRTKMHF